MLLPKILSGRFPGKALTRPLFLLSIYVEDSPVNTMDVIFVVEQLDWLLVTRDELQQEFGTKAWISHAVYLFNTQINFHSTISLKEYFS